MAKKKDEVVLFQVPATITKISTMADRSVRMQVDTDREMNSAETALLFSLANDSGWFMFKSAPIEFSEVEELEVPDIPKEDDQKSPSQRLRNALFVLWKQEGQMGSFDVYYASRMERLINQIKERLT